MNIHALISNTIVRYNTIILHYLWKISTTNNFLSLFFSLYSNFSKSIFRCEPYIAISHLEYSNKFKLSLKKDIAKNRVGYTSNVIYNDKYEQQSLFAVPLSDLSLYKHNDLYVIGDSDLLIDSQHKLAINDYCYNKDDNRIYRDSIYLNQKNNMLLLRALNTEQVKHFDSVIVINGVYSNNYYHALYDNLLRILAINDLIDKNAVMLVDKNSISIPSLNIIINHLTNKLAYKLYIIDKKEIIHADNVYYITHINSFISGMRNWRYLKPEDYVYDLKYLHLLRSQLLTISSHREFPKRIFISRKNTQRRKFNEEDVYKLIRPFGFQIVFPEELSIYDQISLFQTAECIIGGSGAAFVNLLFCSPGCRILIIRKTMLQEAVFSTIAYYLKCNCRHYSMHTLDIPGKLQNDYYVDVDDFLKVFHYTFDGII